jgi:hypothetical protein
LTLFLTPYNHVPFYAATYIPPAPRYGMRSFPDILQAVHNTYREQKHAINEQNQTLQNHLQQINLTETRDVELTDAVFHAMSEQLLSQFDSKHGGFTPKPKFPHAYFIERCFRQFTRLGAREGKLLDAGLFTALKMAQGGLFDQIGGGFCRYSTDEQWMIPHFEKMLYDNGQLMPIYSWANQLRPDFYFEHAVSLSAEWLMREMQSKAGGYYSSQDADSEGEEGKYYIWQPDEVSSILSESDYSIFRKIYGLDRSANFEGRWYPHTYRSIAQLGNETGHSADDIQQSLERSRQRLLAARSQRVRPGTDDKILTSWNALMIRGMLIASRIFERAEYADSALRALGFVKQHLWQNRRLLATWKDGRAHINAYLDDYAYLLLTCLEALQTRWDNDLFDWCRELADRLIELFSNDELGGFYFTSYDHETLILRSQTFNDDAMPSGNAIAAQALYYLGFLCADTRYLDYAERTLKAASMQLAGQPILHAALLNAADIKLHSATIIILRGPAGDLKKWQHEVNRHYLPDTLCFAIDDQTEPHALLAEKTVIEKKTSAYICTGMSCQEPVTNFAAFADMLRNGAPGNLED